jgi:prepilin-type N-terminal cleavage/methylation domain-containing protein
MEMKYMQTGNNKGFTLMEILVSVGILSIVATLLAQVLFTTVHVNKKTEILSNIKQDGNFALDVIGRMVRSAKSIDVCANNDLEIRNPDNNVTTITCFSDGKAARVASVSGSGTVYLTGSTVTLDPGGTDVCANSYIQVSCPPGILKQVTISFTLGPVGSSGTVYESGSAAFSDTFRMRN